ncbi:MAG: GNAT family N-acetyltransferase [Chloroflexota bacterium]
MPYDIRPINPDEFPGFTRVLSVAFGEVEDQIDKEFSRAWLEFERTLAAFDGAQIVGTAAAVSFALTLPGLTATPAAGITWVSVLPTHRRRGILTSIMRKQLEDVRERGEPRGISREGLLARGQPGQ